jgi:tripartite ATP-independent transporter DctM subunit
MSIGFSAMAPAMFAGLIVFLLIGYPVAFSLAACGLLFGGIGVATGMLEWSYLQALPLRLFGAVMSNDLLLAIPFFTLMGAILEKSRLAEDMLESFGQLFGPVRGGLAYAVILVGAVLGAITGTVAASVIAMGLIALPVMTRYGYDMRITTGVIAASGTITQLIPPALVLIVLADQLDRPVREMYAGAIGPSIAQIIIFCLFILAVSIFAPKKVPALPPQARQLRGWRLALLLVRGLVPSLGLIFVVLGTILLGVATPTESGAMGVVGALLLAWANRRLAWPMLWQALMSTMTITTMVVFILVGSTTFSLVFQGYDGAEWIRSILGHLPGGQLGFLLAVNALVFVLAFFLDFFEIAFIVLPLIAPAAAALGIDLVWFGVLLAANMQTSFMHPPFGFALFYLRSIAPPSVKSSDIYLGALPWVVLQLVLVALIIAFPQVVTAFLPGETGPDPAGVKIELPNTDYGTGGGIDFGGPAPDFGPPR